MDLHIIWFIILGILLAGYGVLDGFDLGVGILHLTAGDDQSRRIFMNSIGPIWDGNEVWLVTFGGALFAAFPIAYAAAFSGFYLPFMLLLCALIFRGVSMEFRSKHESRLWRNAWDLAFFCSSFMIAFLSGVAVGDTLNGLPVEQHGTFIGTMSDLFHPYPLLVGCLSVSVCALHGAIYLYLKTEGSLQKQIHDRIWSCFGVFLIFYLGTTIATLVHLPQATGNFVQYPWAWLIVALNVLAIANIPRSIFYKKPGQAFLSSSCLILALTFLFGLALFPNLIRSTLKEEWSLTIYNASSSETTLGIMLIVALIGMPMVLSYTTLVYWIFRGKVKTEDILY